VVEAQLERRFWRWSVYELIEFGGGQQPPLARRSVDPVATSRLPRLSERAAIRAGERAARVLSATGASARTAPSARGNQSRSSRPLVLVALLLLAAAAIVGAIAETHGSKRRLQPLTPPPTTSSRSPSPGRPRRSRSAAELNDEGYSKMRRGDYAGALPLLERAVERLRGAGTLTEAYADFNLANTRYHLGECHGVLALLARSQQIQGSQPAIDTLRGAAGRICS
jgi:hypothetical protein